MREALALVELDSVATGLRAVDALVKRAPVEVLEANLVEPGKFLVLFAGSVAEVEEGYDAATELVPEAVVARMLLPHAHPALLEGLAGREVRDEPDCLGLVEGGEVARTLVACDRSLKDAGVKLAGIRVAGGLAGRAYYVVSGPQHDIEAALDAGAVALAEALYRRERIANPHPDMLAWLLRPAPFRLQH